MVDMIGKTISHYQILEKLGEGGMGVVYKAWDTHLARFVALKILPAEKVADLDRKRRLVQEARASSGVNHPSVVEIDDISQVQSVGFIAFEFPEEGTPRSRTESKRLDWDETLELGPLISVGRRWFNDSASSRAPPTPGVQEPRQNSVPSFNWRSDQRNGQGRCHNHYELWAGPDHRKLDGGERCLACHRFD
jgi:hypothetical protein